MQWRIQGVGGWAGRSSWPSKKTFSALRTSVWPKNNGGGAGPLGPSPESATVIAFVLRARDTEAARERRINTRKEVATEAIKIQTVPSNVNVLPGAYDPDLAHFLFTFFLAVKTWATKKRKEAFYLPRSSAPHYQAKEMLQPDRLKDLADPDKTKKKSAINTLLIFETVKQSCKNKFPWES